MCMSCTINTTVIAKYYSIIYLYYKINIGKYSNREQGLTSCWVRIRYQINRTNITERFRTTVFSEYHDHDDGVCEIVSASSMVE